MSNITYFPRYSNQENAVTNTVLHLFSQVYGHSTERLQGLVGELLGSTEIPLGINFEQQTRSAMSVPDAIIRQDPVHIVIETKVGAPVDSGQLVRHCNTFNKSLPGNFLVLLTKEVVPDEGMAPVRDAAKEHNAAFCKVTFEGLCEILGTAAMPHEIHLKNIVEDFKRYCSEMNLLPDRRKWLSIVPCSETYDLNEKWALYYKPTDRGYEPVDYLGIYTQKAVRMLGEIKAVYDSTIDSSGRFTLACVKGDHPDFRTRIQGMVDDSAKELGWMIKGGMRFFCCDRFWDTEFKKTSPYGIQGGRYWDISAQVKESGATEALADLLRQHTWE